MTRRLKILGLLVLMTALLMFMLLPPRTVPAPAGAATTIRGAFHIHSNRSDGSGSLEDIAAAASRAGLQFIILTDHGDATRPVAAPAYLSGVLTIDGVELNTTAGHYAAFGLPQSPYPIAGAPDDVIDDVHRLGGFGVAAHPGSPRASLIPPGLPSAGSTTPSARPRTIPYRPGCCPSSTRRRVGRPS